MSTIKNICLLILLSLTYFSNAQNLIKNGSFEERKPGTNCPNGPWNVPNSNQGFPRYWSHGPIGSVIGTPDYLQTCATIQSGYHPEYHVYGQETSRTGNSIAGIIAYSPFTFHPSGEYLIQELENPLFVGQQYYIEFYVSLSDLSKYSLSGLGMYFTNNYNDFNSPNGSYGLFNLSPQIPNTFPSNLAYSSTNGWTKISGYFTPSVSGIKYIAIGEFSGNTTTRSISSEILLAYYYIDDVSLVPVCPVGPPATVTQISIYQQNCGTYLEWWLDPVQWIPNTIYTWTFANHGNPTPFFTTQSVSAPAYVSLYGNSNSAWDITVTPQNACGVGGTYSTTWLNPCDDGGGDETFSIFPNPSSDEIIIASEVFEIQSDDIKSTVTIINDQNQVVFQNELQKGKITRVQVQSWRTGIYYAKIASGEDVKYIRLAIHR